MQAAVHRDRGTIFEASKLPLSKWFAAIYLMCESKKGVSAHQVHQQLGIQYRSAWYMCRRIREAMREKGPRPILTGAIEADETYVGGKVRGAPMARSRRKARQGRAYPLQDKAIVFGLLQRGEPDVHTQGIENYWSILKRGLTGVFHHVDPAYLPQYLHEFEYRFNRRQITDAERFQALLRRVTGRLEWYRERPALADASEPEPAS